jgi:predicted flap endonuclease-1-like 5' DNA nuclease
MTMKLLWFVLAGFLLGFATSTLWEWFHFRKERLKLTDRRIRELEAKLRDLETDSTSPVSTSNTATSAWSDPAYRSPGVFLETEEFEEQDEEASAPEQDRARPPIPDSTGNLAPAPVSHAEPARFEPVRIEPPLLSRGEQTPADALRARRGDSPRSRQEVLAALRRNSEAVQRGQAPSRIDAESLPADSRLPSQPQSTLVSPIPPETPAAASIAPIPPADSPGASLKVTPTAPRQRWINDPALTRRTQEYPDDLSKIKGIGDVYKQRLYRAGIYTWKQIAESDVEALRRATSAYPSSNVDEWLVQAQKLMEKTGRTDAVYNGPPPDDLTKILGIGPVSAAGLYRAGICTYEQLASTPIADLAALFPIAVAGDQPDFAQWVARAAILADEKHRDQPT